MISKFWAQITSLAGSFSLNDELRPGHGSVDDFEYDSSIFRCKRMQDVAARLLRTGTDEPLEWF